MRKFSKKKQQNTHRRQNIYSHSVYLLKMADKIQPNNIYITRQYILKRDHGRVSKVDIAVMK